MDSVNVMNSVNLVCSDLSELFECIAQEQYTTGCDVQVDTIECHVQVHTEDTLQLLGQTEREKEIMLGPSGGGGCAPA